MGLKNRQKWKTKTKGKQINPEKKEKKKGKK